MGNGIVFLERLLQGNVTAINNRSMFCEYASKVFQL